MNAPPLCATLSRCNSSDSMTHHRPSNGLAELLADWRLRYTVLKRYTSEVECGRWRKRRCGKMQNFRFHRWLALSLDFHVNLALTWICRPLSLTGSVGHRVDCWRWCHVIGRWTWVGHWHSNKRARVLERRWMGSLYTNKLEWVCPWQEEYMMSGTQ